jgi:hypothetical protein
MAYYNDAKYFKESDMSVHGWSKERKAGQRELNWRIRLEHYATNSHVLKNCVQFRNMVEKLCESFETHSAGVPTMTMVWILNLARENGIRSDTLREFRAAEEKKPGFASIAIVPLNEEKRRKLALCALKARAEKRERNVAGILGETVGKGAAKERRAGVKIAWTDAVRKGTELVDAKVAAEARRMGGANLEAIEELKKKLMHEMMVDAYVERINASASSKFK